MCILKPHYVITSYYDLKHKRLKGACQCSEIQSLEDGIRYKSLSVVYVTYNRQNVRYNTGKTEMNGIINGLVTV